LLSDPSAYGSGVSESRLLELCMTSANGDLQRDYAGVERAMRRNADEANLEIADELREQQDRLAAFAERFEQIYLARMQGGPAVIGVKDVAAIETDMTVAPRWIDGRLSYVHRFRTDDALLAYVAMLLADPERPFGSKVCRCKLDTCRRFFFERKPPSGKPRRLYCCDEHMVEAHGLGSSKRSRNARSKPLMAKKRRRSMK
jgi:hypothetical protein